MRTLTPPKWHTSAISRTAPSLFYPPLMLLHANQPLLLLCHYLWDKKRHIKCTFTVFQIFRLLIKMYRNYNLKMVYNSFTVTSFQTTKTRDNLSILSSFFISSLLLLLFPIWKFWLVQWKLLADKQSEKKVSVNFDNMFPNNFSGTSWMNCWNYFEPDSKNRL